MDITDKRREGPNEYRWVFKAEFEEFNRMILEQLSYVGKLLTRQEKNEYVTLTYQEREVSK
jgi:hypothetical protein